MKKGFCNVSIKQKKYTKSSRGSLANLGKHLLRIDNQENKLIDVSKTQSNEILINLEKETINKSLDAFLEKHNLTTRRKDQVQAYQVIFSCDKKTFDDPKLLEAWKNETLSFMNSNPIFKDNVLLAVFHKDETQPHIQAVIVPRTKDNRLHFNELLGGLNGAEKLSKLHDDYAKHYKKLGFERGDGTHTNNMNFKNYKKAMAEVAKPIEKIEVVEEQKILGVVVNKQEIIDSQAKQLKSLNNEKKKLYFYENQNISLKKNQKQLKEKAKRSIELEKKVAELEQSQKLSIEKDKRFKQIFNENLNNIEVNKQLKEENEKLAKELAKATIQAEAELKKVEEQQKLNNPEIKPK